MSNIPATSKENTIDELGKIIPPPLMKNYDCVIVLVPKKNDDPPQTVNLENNIKFQAKPSDTSVNSANDAKESDLIDFHSNTADNFDIQSTPSLNRNSLIRDLTLDLDELEKMYLKKSERKSKSIFGHDTSNTTLIPEMNSSIVTDNKIIEIDDTSKLIFPILKRASSDTSAPDYRFDEQPKILIPKLERNISETSNLSKMANKPELLCSTSYGLRKADDDEIFYKSPINKNDKDKISQLFPLDKKIENINPPTLKHLLNSTVSGFEKSNQNPIPNCVRKTSEMSDIYRLDENPIDLLYKLKNNDMFNEFSVSRLDKNIQNQSQLHVRDNIYRVDEGPKELTNKQLFDGVVDDFDENYEDLLDELSLIKSGRMSITNNTTESGKMNFNYHVPLTRPKNTEKAQNAYNDELLNNKKSSNDPVIKNPTNFNPLTQLPLSGPIEQLNTEAQKAYIDKLLNSKTKIQNPLMYYDPKKFYSPDPRNDEEYILIMKTKNVFKSSKDTKEYNKKRIITSESDKAKFTDGPDFKEKQYILPEIMKKLKEKKARLEIEKNLEKRLRLGSATPVQNDVVQNNNPNKTPTVTTESSVKLNPVVLTEDCNKERLKALKKRQMFDYFMQTRSYI